MATDYELTPSDYLSIMRWRAPYLIGTFVVVILITLLAVIFIPRTFESTGTIMVESQEVPESVVPTQVQESVDERIHNIAQRILTRESLLTIANKYNLFGGSSRFLSSMELVQHMRDSVGIELINIDTIKGSSTGKATIAFKLSFQNRDPKIAYQVTKDLVGLFLAWNVKLQTERATETTLFLTQAADKQQQDVDRLNKQISDYKQLHQNALPELTNLYMVMLQNDKNELQSIDQQSGALQAQLQEGGNDSTSASLPALKARLARLSSIYNDSHPDIQALKLKIAALEGGNGNSGVAGAPGSAAAKGGTKAGPTQDMLQSLAQQRKVLQARIAKNEAAILQTPEVAQGLATLVSERDSAQHKYEEIVGQQQNAEMAEKLKRENKADRFVLLEPPVMPDKPFKPNPVKIMVMGFFLAIVSSGGMLMAMVAMDRQIRGADALEHVLGTHPLAVIPYLTLEEEEADRKRKIKIAIVVFVVFLIAVALAIQFFYMPLTELAMKILGMLLA